MKLARGEHRNRTGSTFLKRSEPAGRNQLDQGLALAGVVGQVTASQPGVHVARRHRVGGHAVRRVLVGDHPHELVERALGRGIGPWSLWPLRPATEEKNTMRPRPCSRIATAACAAR
jgi:hypothetical protein